VRTENACNVPLEVSNRRELRMAINGATRLLLKFACAVIQERKAVSKNSSLANDSHPPFSRNDEAQNLSLALTIVLHCFHPRE